MILSCYKTNVLKEVSRLDCLDILIENKEELKKAEKQWTLEVVYNCKYFHLKCGCKNSTPLIVTLGEFGEYHLRKKTGTEHDLTCFFHADYKRKMRKIILEKKGTTKTKENITLPITSITKIFSGNCLNSIRSILIFTKKIMKSIWNKDEAKKLD